MSQICLENAATCVFEKNTFKISGAINKYTRDGLYQQIIGKINKKNTKQITIDITNCSYIDSEGIGLLIKIRIYVNLYSNDKKITVKTNSEIYKKLDKNGFSKLFNLVME